MQRIWILIIAFMGFGLASNTWAGAVSGNIIMDFDLSAHDSAQEAQLWIPYPVTDEDQLISDIRINGDYAESGVYTDRTYQTPMLYARWEKGAKSRKLSFSFAVHRREILRGDLPVRAVSWNPADYALYLAPTRLGPIDGEVRAIANKITDGRKSVLEKARALYDWTVDNTYRDPETRGCGVGDVDRLLKEPGGKCADISSIFVALSRAAGVPAREVFGIRQGKEPVEDISTFQHCWAEFYLPGHGWVSVDPADVRKMMLVQNLALSDSKTAYYRDYFWGGIDAYRVKLGEGRDVILNPPQYGEPLNFLMYPYAQVGKTTLDWLDPQTFKYTITYKQE